MESPKQYKNSTQTNYVASGQKLGLAVSITSVGEKAKKSSEEEQVVAEDQVKEESVNIKTEPDEVRTISCHELSRPVKSCHKLTKQ